LSKTDSCLNQKIGNTLEHQRIFIMTKATQFLRKMSRFMVLMLVIVNLISIVEGNRFGPFGGGGLRGLGPFGRGGFGGGFGGLGPFGGVGPFGGGGLGFPINNTFPGLNITLPAINGSFPGFPFPGFPFP
jgi:hypothetical protein